MALRNAAKKPQRTPRKVMCWLEQMEYDNAEKIVVSVQKDLTAKLCKKALSNEEGLAYNNELQQQLKDKEKEDAQHHKRLLQSLKKEFDYLKWKKPSFGLYLMAGTCRWRAAFDVVDMAHSRLSGYVRNYFHAKSEKMKDDRQRMQFLNIFVDRCHCPFKHLVSPTRWTYYKLAAFLCSDPLIQVHEEHVRCAKSAEKELQNLAEREGFSVSAIGDIRIQVAEAFSGPFPERNLDASSTILMLQDLQLRAKVLEDVQKIADYSDFKGTEGLIKFECYLQLKICDQVRREKVGHKKS